eukprot:scaffold2442_cov146-Cylindrotheca_fusiformis.AAC.3
MAGKRKSPVAVVDLALELDEEQEPRLGDVRKRLHPDSCRQHKKTKTDSANNVPVADKDELVIVPPPQEDSKPPVIAVTSVAASGVQIMTVPTDRVSPVASLCEMVGTKNEVRLPHNRCSCTAGAGINRSTNSTVIFATALHITGRWYESHCDATDNQSRWVRKRLEAKLQKQFGNGPFESGSAPVSAYPEHYPACVKCGWHSAIFAMQDLRCLKCGRRTIKSKDMNKGVPYRSVPTDHFLGTKTIMFRIIAGDVRSMEQYRSSWEEADANDPKWKYDDEDMQSDFFNYKIGTNPTAKSFLANVSEWDADELWDLNRDGVVLDNPNDIPLLRLLANEYFAESGNHRDRHFKGDLKCTWKKGEGALRIRLYLPFVCIHNRFRPIDEYAFLLGCWFDIFPFELADLCGALKASEPKYCRMNIPRDTERVLIGAACEHNKTVRERMSSLSFTSSCGKTFISGNVDRINNLEGILLEFFKEASSNIVLDCSIDQNDFEKISTHRVNSNESKSCYCLLNHHDRVVAGLYLENSARTTRMIMPSVTNVLAHLENLGHEPEETCEELSIELLPFQKQTLRWALDRETVPGGIQSFFWAKVPGVELYFNPILGRFRKQKPRQIRGGIIAEEMGLGKTVISLALILKHPAPQLPISGSSIASLSETVPASNEETSKWDRDLYGRTSTSNPKRGSILSRGTLVICPVSLVGQWIEEAKSKLDDPGLLYSYYGPKRNRDARILARNAIVVTTYQVLVSDDTHHRGKSNDPSSYCPPVEQVRWWRIICDEGHALRQASTKQAKSILKLAADHKWLVTGTPANTSVLDLQNQLKFIGIEHVDDVFETFSTDCHPTSTMYRNRYHNKMMFLLRSVIMRHTQKQLYRGTKTTLMSLPSKTERTIEVTLPTVERQEYDALETAAKTFYLDFKGSHSRKLSSHYMKLFQNLTPMRVACSGGCIPLDDGGGAADECEDMDEDRLVVARKKDAVKYSDFAFRAKFRVLIKELKKAREKDPTSKSLVFSLYSSTLEWLKNELPKHGFQYRMISGSMSMKQRAKSLRDFQSDPPTTIFLLSMRAGNCGINLTQANRVFLMEPGFNPALEQQAIGRVHRLGQKRKVRITRLLVKDSVETRIRKFLEKKSLEKQYLPHKEEPDGMIGPLGNVSTERPRSKIMAEEFDILYGVSPNDTASGDDQSCRHPGRRSVIPDPAISAGFI